MGTEVLSLLLLPAPAACSAVQTRPGAAELRLNRSLPSSLLLISTPPPSSPLNLPPDSGHAHAERKFLAGKNQLFNPLLLQAQQPGARRPQTCDLAPPPPARLPQPPPGHLPGARYPRPPAAERPPGAGACGGVPVQLRSAVAERAPPAALRGRAASAGTTRRSALLPAGLAAPPPRRAKGQDSARPAQGGRGRKAKGEKENKRWGEDGGRDPLHLRGSGLANCSLSKKKILREDPRSLLPVRSPPPG